MDTSRNTAPFSLIFVAILYILIVVFLILGMILFLTEFSKLGEIDFNNYLTNTGTYKLYVYTSNIGYHLLLIFSILTTAIGILKNRKWAAKIALSASWDIFIFSIIIITIVLASIIINHELFNKLLYADDDGLIIAIAIISIFLFFIIYSFIISIPLLSIFIISKKNNFVQLAVDDRFSIFLQDHSVLSIMPLLVCLKSAFSIIILLPFNWLPIPFAGSYITGMNRNITLLIFLFLNLISILFMVRKHVAGWALGFLTTMGYIFLSASVLYGNPSEIFLNHLESYKTYISGINPVTTGYFSMLPAKFFFSIAVFFSISYIIIFSISFMHYYSKYPNKNINRIPE